MLFRLLCLSIAIGVGSMGTKAISAEVTPNISYGSSGQKLDLCQPTTNERQTGLIFIHGGGFAQGNRGQMLGYCKLFANGGFPSATISYRLTSQGHAYPKALNDVFEAITWMQNRGGIRKIVLIGYSAGATLALDAGLANGSGVAGIVDVAGLSDFRTILEANVPQQLKSELKRYLNGASAAEASPLSDVSADDPPVFIFHGKKDHLVPVAQSVVLARKLQNAGVKVLFRVFDDAGHEIMLPNPHLKQLLRETTKFLMAIDQN